VPIGQCDNWNISPKNEGTLAQLSIGHIIRRTMAKRKPFNLRSFSKKHVATAEYLAKKIRISNIEPKKQLSPLLSTTDDLCYFCQNF
jgi:hypothetical protein